MVFLTLDDSTGPVDATFFEDAQDPYAPVVFAGWLLLVRGLTRRTGPRGISIRATGCWDLGEVHEIWQAGGRGGVAEYIATFPTVDTRRRPAAVVDVPVAEQDAAKQGAGTVAGGGGSHRGRRHGPAPAGAGARQWVQAVARTPTSSPLVGIRRRFRALRRRGPRRRASCGTRARAAADGSRGRLVHERRETMGWASPNGRGQGGRGQGRHGQGGRAGRSAVSRSQITRPQAPRGLGDDDAGCPILHVDMDAFYASVEVARRPELRGKTMIVGGEGGRGVVLAASYEARKYGIHSAMPMSRALRLAPDLVIVPPDGKHYSAVSAAVMELFAAITPRVEPLSLDEAFLDVSGARLTHGSPRRIAALIRAQVYDEQGITCSVGVAPTKFVAKLASTQCKPDGLLVVPADRVISFLHPMPVGALWGVGERTEEQLLRLGLRTVSDIARTPRATLVRALGQASGTHLHDLAWGRDPRVVGHSRARAQHRQRGDVRPRRRRPRGDPGRAAASVREGGRPAAPSRLLRVDREHQGALRGLHDHHPHAHPQRADRREPRDLPRGAHPLRGPAPGPRSDPAGRRAGGGARRDRSGPDPAGPRCSGPGLAGGGGGGRPARGPLRRRAACDRPDCSRKSVRRRMPVTRSEPRTRLGDPGLTKHAASGFLWGKPCLSWVCHIGRVGLREVMVPLSEHEQRLLDQMERALYAEDPKFATSMRNPNPLAGDKRRIALGVLALLAGMGLLLAGVATKLVIIGVLGFLAMLGGLWLAVVALRPTVPAKQAGASQAGAAPTSPAPARTTRAAVSRPRRARHHSTGESLAERMERRWRRRRETGDF